jgi:hypothetical protein
MADEGCEYCTAYRKEISHLEAMVVDPESYREDRMKLMLKRIMGFFEKAYNRKMTEGFVGRDFPRGGRLVWQKASQARLSYRLSLVTTKE